MQNYSSRSHYSGIPYPICSFCHSHKSSYLVHSIPFPYIQALIPPIDSCTHTCTHAHTHTHTHTFRCPNYIIPSSYTLIPIHPFSHSPYSQTVGQGQVHDSGHRGCDQTPEGGEGVDRCRTTHEPLQDHSQRTTTKETQTSPVMSHNHKKPLYYTTNCCYIFKLCVQCCLSLQQITIIIIIH